MSLRHTLECGQVFRWRAEGGWYLGVVSGAAVKVRATGGWLEARSRPALGPDFFRRYFRLDDDLDAIYERISRDEHVRQAVSAYRGLRLLRQEPWECLASYILSAASNIPRISRAVEGLSRSYGRRVGLEGWATHSFPSPDALCLAGVDALTRHGLGFRARYLFEAARAVAEGRIDLERLGELPTEEARGELMACAGVGPKVADCVLLFAMDRLEVFPVDRWVRRAVEELFFNGERLSGREVREWGMERYGRYAGYAQQYLFHYIRHFKA
ncbi:MAG: DNA-3-methyladenine glycosylase family protein [Thermoplasmatota archaeon]